MTKEDLIQLRNQLARHIFSRCNISNGQIGETEATRIIEKNEILYKFGLWDNVKFSAIKLTLAQGDIFTDRDRRKYAEKIRKQRKNDPQIYLILSYEFEVGNTHRNSPQKQVSTRRFLYHYIRKNDTECINFKSKLETYKDSTRNLEISHINRWIAKKEICLGTQIAQINDGNIVKLNSDYIPDECIQTVQSMKERMEDGIETYFRTNDPDKLISDSIVSDLRGASDTSDRIIIEAAKNAYESISNTPYTDQESFSTLFCSLEDKDITNENSNKTDDKWEGAREELLKEILRQITPSNMSTKQKNKTDNQKFVNKMLSILFPNHKYTPETKDKGIDFLHTLLENKTYGGVNILSTAPIFDGSNRRRSYKPTYNIEGTDYYISNDWTWDGAPNLKAYKVIPEICNQDYVTETMKQQLQELAEEWSQSVPKTPQKESTKTSRNLIYFGAPGTGKSYLLNEKAKDFESEQSGTEVTECGLTEYVERVTFHTEYTYFDFVGSYKPMMEGQNIKYAFEPGPFARVLKKALSNPGKDYLLIIEEINRARVAAVFGDMFQLLDRNKNGQSEYFITPAKDLLTYLTTEEKDEAGNIIQQRAELEGGKLRLPANMFIWATMNSADQGVFPMDTAFKRRWSFKYVGIDESEDNIKGNCAEEWKELRKRINQLLQEAGINEDKQLGPFFLKETELEDVATFKEAFAEKVIMYLFEDAARHHRSHIFTQDNPRYSTLTDAFKRSQGSIFNTPKQQDSNTQESDSENS